MPSSKHPVFKWPNDSDIKIWRYLDFAKFICMLEDEALFFCRADCFEDRLEGSYSKANDGLRRIRYGALYEPISKKRAREAEWLRQWTMINCWHMNESETALMWKLYAQTNQAICLQSTFERLHQCLDDKTYIGEVEYIDYATDPIPEGNTYYPFLHKRTFFEHERELRAIRRIQPRTEHDKIDWRAVPADRGRSIGVSLDQMIEAIYVAPFCLPWFRELVMKSVARYGLVKPVIPSLLEVEPFY